MFIPLWALILLVVVCVFWRWLFAGVVLVFWLGVFLLVMALPLIAAMWMYSKW
jgi:hypothetical protein